MSRPVMANTRRSPIALLKVQRLKQRPFKGADLLALILGLGSSFSLHLIGNIQASEILMLVLLPILLVIRVRGMMRPRMALLLMLMFLWLFGQVMTDIYRGTAWFDWVRGDAAILFFGLNIIGLSLILGRDERRIAIFYGAVAVSSLLQARLQPVDAFWDQPWKFGYGWGTTLLIVLVSCYFFHRRNYIIVGALLAGIVGVNLVMNFRSLVLALLVAMALVVPVVPEHIGRLRLLPRAGSTARVFVLAGFALGAAGAAIGLVGMATKAGIVGAESKSKNQEQMQSGLGPLLSGRPEILVSSRAVMDSPILGHGSWAKGYKYLEMLTDLEVENGIAVSLDYSEEMTEGFIPTHSHLMGAWVSAGILGAVFWTYVLSLALMGMVRAAVMRPALAPVYALTIFSFAWDILFSPFGTSRRITEALLLVVVFNLLESSSPIVQAPREMIRKRMMGRFKSQAAIPAR